MLKRQLRYSRLKERVGEGVAVTKERKQAAEVQKIEVEEKKGEGAGDEPKPEKLGSNPRWGLGGVPPTFTTYQVFICLLLLYRTSLRSCLR